MTIERALFLFQDWLNSRGWSVKFDKETDINWIYWVNSIYYYSIKTLDIRFPDILYVEGIVKGTFYKTIFYFENNTW